MGHVREPLSALFLKIAPLRDRRAVYRRNLPTVLFAQKFRFKPHTIYKELEMKLKRAVLFVLLAWGFRAHPATLIFDDLVASTGSSATAIGHSYTAGGFTLSATSSQFYVFGPDSAQWTGSPGLTLFAVGGQIELSRLDGMLFDLQSIDLSRGDSNRSLIPVSFTGYFANGTTTQSTYFFPDAVTGRNDSFFFGSEFSGLTKAVWFQGAEWHQFDNIHLAISVPEPGMLTLLVVALLGLFLRGYGGSLRSKLYLAIASRCFGVIPPRVKVKPPGVANF